MGQPVEVVALQPEQAVQAESQPLLEPFIVGRPGIGIVGADLVQAQKQE